MFFTNQVFACLSFNIFSVQTSRYIGLHKPKPRNIFSDYFYLSSCSLIFALNFFISVNFCFSFVSNSLAYITIPKDNAKIKINWYKKKLITTYTLRVCLCKHRSKLQFVHCISRAHGAVFKVWGPVTTSFEVGVEGMGKFGCSLFVAV